MQQLLSQLNSDFIMAALTAVAVLVVVGLFMRSYFANQRRDKYTKMLLAKTEGAQQRSVNLIMDAQARASRDSGRYTPAAGDLFSWTAIRRDLKRAGLPAFPLVIFAAAAALSYVVAAIIIAAPIFDDWKVALCIYPMVFYITRTGLLGIFIDSRKMAMLTQMISFMESVQRAVSVGSSPDDAVAEAIGECGKPLLENVTAIRDLLELGYDFIDALSLAADRINMAEFDIFVAALSAQATTGGSIGDVLKEVIDIARARRDLQRKIATLTAEGRFNALLLGSLPIALSIYLRTSQPDYAAESWTHPIGMILYFGHLGAAVLGAMVALKLSKVTV